MMNKEELISKIYDLVCKTTKEVANDDEDQSLSYFSYFSFLATYFFPELNLELFFPTIASRTLLGEADEKFDTECSVLIKKYSELFQGDNYIDVFVEVNGKSESDLQNLINCFVENLKKLQTNQNDNYEYDVESIVKIIESCLSEENKARKQYSIKVLTDDESFSHFAIYLSLIYARCDIHINMSVFLERIYKNKVHGDKKIREANFYSLIAKNVELLKKENCSDNSINKCIIFTNKELIRTKNIKNKDLITKRVAVSLLKNI